MSSSKKRGATGKSGASKKPRVAASDSSEVTVVVGGEEFTENIHHLRSCSDYFDAAFRSGMKESQQRKFEFPDKDPEEWKMIRLLLMPFPRVEITEKNIKIVVAWFDELCITRGLEECDQALVKILEEYGAKERNYGFREISDVDFFFEYMSFCVQYRLKESQAECVRQIVQFFDGFCELWDIEHLKLLPSVLSAAEEAGPRQLFWTAVECFLPEALIVPGFEETLFDNEMVPYLLHAEIRSLMWKIRADNVVGSVVGTPDILPISAVKDKLCSIKNRQVDKWIKDNYLS